MAKKECKFKYCKKEKHTHYYCDQCGQIMSKYQNRIGKGLCKNCVMAIN